MKVARVRSKTLLTKTLWYVWYDIHTHSALITNYWQLYRNAAFLMPFCIIRQVPSAQPLKPKYKHFWDSSPDVLLCYCTLYIQLISIHRGLGQCLKKKHFIHILASLPDESRNAANKVLSNSFNSKIYSMSGTHLSLRRAICHIHTIFVTKYLLQLKRIFPQKLITKHSH